MENPTDALDPKRLFFWCLPPVVFAGFLVGEMGIQHDSTCRNGIYDSYQDIRWMEEILHQLVDGFSHDNPIIYSVS